MLTIPVHIPAQCTWSSPRCIRCQVHIDPFVVLHRFCRCRTWRNLRDVDTWDAEGSCQTGQQHRRPDIRSRRLRRHVSRFRTGDWRPPAKRSSTSWVHRSVQVDKAPPAPPRRCSWRNDRTRSGPRGWRCRSRVGNPC